MGKFTDGQAIPPMPRNVPGIQSSPGEAEPISQAWAGSPPIGKEHTSPEVESDIPDADDDY